MLGIAAVPAVPFFVVDDYVAHEGAFIPHFYNDYYVFQYATSFTASSALSEKVLAGIPGLPTAICDLSRLVSRSILLNCCRTLGVDMTSDEPLKLTVKKMNRVMDEVEKLLDSNTMTAGN